MLKRCEDCGKNFKATSYLRKYCNNCLIKRNIECRKRESILHKKATSELLKNHKCSICGEKLNNIRLKYCSKCASSLNVLRQVLNNKKQSYEWSKLDESERLKRMELVSKKLLNEYDKKDWIFVKEYLDKKRKKKELTFEDEKWKQLE